MPFPVDGKWIAQTEQKLAVRFPAAFVVSMASQNGGCVAVGADAFDLFPFLDASDRKRLGRTCNSIDRETATARQGKTGFPNDAVAIGKNHYGDLLVLLPLSPDSIELDHSIFVWNHETSEISPVARDFNELRRQ